MRYAATVAVTVLTLGAAGAAAADTVHFAQRDPDFPPRVYTCRADGADVPLGGKTCLSTLQGRTLAECGFVQNVSTWKPSGSDCP